METGPRPTDFATWSPTGARAACLGAGLLTALLVGVSLSPWQSGFATAEGRGDAASDVHLYLAEVGRIRQGEGYYQAAGQELSARGYPTSSVFNWRTPWPMWLVGQLPQADLGRWLLGLAALGVIAGSMAVVEREGSLRQALGSAVLLVGALLPCVLPTAFIMPVVWAGTFIAGSMVAFGRGKTKLGVGLGLAAMFLRDLAVGYGVVSLGLAMYRRRWGEAAGWCIGLLMWGAFFAWHAAQVAVHRPPDAMAHMGSWWQWGGVPFVLAVSQMNVFLLLLPQWVTALYLGMALLGLAGWQGAWGERLGVVVAGYLLAFAVVGFDFNQYWGALIAPLLCFGAARGPQAMGELWRATGWLVGSCTGEWMKEWR